MGLCWYSRYSLWMRDSEQTMQHLLRCPLLENECSLEDLATANEKALHCARAWPNIWLNSEMMDTKEESCDDRWTVQYSVQQCCHLLMADVRRYESLKVYWIKNACWLWLICICVYIAYFFTICVIISFNIFGNNLLLPAKPRLQKIPLESCDLLWLLWPHQSINSHPR